MDFKKIARKLEREKCLKHNEKPIVTVKKDDIELKCCCIDFRDKLTNKMEKEISKQVEDDFNKSLNL